MNESSLGAQTTEKQACMVATGESRRCMEGGIVAYCSYVNDEGRTGNRATLPRPFQASEMKLLETKIEHLFCSTDSSTLVLCLLCD